MKDKRKINLELRKEAADIYETLPKNVKRGEWVSDAVIEKHSKEQQQPSIEERITRLEDRVDRLEEWRDKE
uniref:Uncharacterized protein n=1 Tax=viral metagenome TaxID=1070528 RepID=A0A6H1ZYA7_9ZZZZ